MATCANGHPVADGGRFCPTCGAAITQAAPAPAAPTGATPPPSAAPSLPGTPGGNVGGRSKRTIAIVAGAAVAALAVVLIAALALRGGSPEPLTAATARAALLSDSDLPMAFEVDTEPNELDPDVAYDPDSTPECTVVLGVSRLSDIDTTMPLGSAAFPVEARAITVFEGVDFSDTLESVVSSFDERIIVFPTEDEASTYLESIGRALEGCPVATRNSSSDSFTYVSVETFRDVEQGGDSISWRSDSVSTIESDFLDTTIKSANGVTVLQRGANVLVTDWYLDDDDTMTDESQMVAASKLAEERFTEATG